MACFINGRHRFEAWGSLDKTFNEICLVIPMFFSPLDSFFCETSLSVIASRYRA